MEELFTKLVREGKKENKELDMTSRFTIDGHGWTIQIRPEHTGNSSNEISLNPFYGVDRTYLALPV